MFWLVSRVFIGATIPATIPLYGFGFLEIMRISRDAFSSEKMLIRGRREREMVEEAVENEATEKRTRDRGMADSEREIMTRVVERGMV
jgi:hypothetical protein